jgi:hypothetical protein
VNWQKVGVVGKRYLRDEFPSTTDGYDNTIRDDAVAYTFSSDTKSFGRIDAFESTFSLRSGHFASAWNTGETVKFVAFREGNKVGQLTVVLDQNTQQIEFTNKFKHIDAVEITASGGTDADAADDEEFGFGHHVAMDNLSIKLDESAAVADDAVASANHFALMHNYDWLLA